MWNENSPLFFVPNSTVYTCGVSALSPAPSVVQNFTIISYTVIRNMISLNFSWEQPLEPNGIIKNYSLCVSGEELTGNTYVGQQCRHFMVSKTVGNTATRGVHCVSLCVRHVGT